MIVIQPQLAEVFDDLGSLFLDAVIEVVSVIRRKIYDLSVLERTLPKSIRVEVGN